MPLEAFSIDNDLVNSQETRRILDRIIGFRLSKLIQSKTNGSSAGRVQSVALKLIVDRDREIEKFVAEEYWKVLAKFDGMEAELEKYLAKIEANERLQNVQYKDNLKNDYAKDNNIPLLRIEYVKGIVELDKWKKLIEDKIKEINFR